MSEMSNAERTTEGSQEPLSPEAVASLIETAREGGFESFPQQREAVMELWEVARNQADEPQDSAVRGLNELAREHLNRGVSLLAQDRLGRILKEAPDGSPAKQLAQKAIRGTL